MPYRDAIRRVLGAVERGELSADDALERLAQAPYEDIGFARLDAHRPLRTGQPEFVLCQGKSTDQVVAIVKRLADHHDVLATRASPDQARAIGAALPDADWNELARTVTWRHPSTQSAPERTESILVVTAGTADLPVAEEALVTARHLRHPVDTLTDVGIAGLHRLLDSRHRLTDAHTIIVVAGMDGALPGVIAGLVDRPIVAVPTSTGYGAAFGGIAPLLTMLNACAPGVAVVNIDNGFGAACFASRIRFKTASPD